MDIQYFKRYRMEIKLAGREFLSRPMAPEYRFYPFSQALLEGFALAKYRSFRQEPDVQIFPCLGELEGCRKLMTEIVRKPGFTAQATWLAIYYPVPHAQPEYCGTIQGIRDPTGRGAIQNLGVTPEHRAGGLGTNLLSRCLEGFRRSGVHRVQLEVTAHNAPAIRLYRRMGFFTVKTVYKTVEPVAVSSLP
ncbi:MAG: GNAT family N-acetyltransferase [Pirellulales bacterium]|nr:GNAT family N-acetyltransferase [Pirellulales bacterium]